jgi:IclR family acetate operon transcriptional repressor
MQARGYLYEIGPRGGYYPTLRLKHMAAVFADHDPIVLRAEIVLRALRDELNESVLLAKVNGLQAVYLLALEPSHPLRFLNRVGDMVRTLNATSGGKALLGSLEPQALDVYLDTVELPRLTARTITSKSAMKREIGRVRGSAPKGRGRSCQCPNSF